jgi:hypothetical protein
MTPTRRRSTVASAAVLRRTKPWCDDAGSSVQSDVLHGIEGVFGDIEAISLIAAQIETGTP